MYCILYPLLKSLHTHTDRHTRAQTHKRRYKICLVGFFVTVVLPNLKYMWGFQGYKDEFDRQRREHDDQVGDESRANDLDPALERERTRIRTRIARSVVKARSNATCQSKCAYGQKCCTPQQSLQPCEHPGCSMLVHRSCVGNEDAIDILCPEHLTAASTNVNSSPAPAVSVRRSLFSPDPLTTVEDIDSDSEQPVISAPTAGDDTILPKHCSYGQQCIHVEGQDGGELRRCSVGVRCPHWTHRLCSMEVGKNMEGVWACPLHAMVTPQPATPAMLSRVDGPTPRRQGRGGAGRKAAVPFVAGFGQLPDLLKKNYNKGPRAQVKA